MNILKLKLKLKLKKKKKNESTLPSKNITHLLLSGMIKITYQQKYWLLIYYFPTFVKLLVAVHLNHVRFCFSMELNQTLGQNL